MTGVGHDCVVPNPRAGLTGKYEPPATHGKRSPDGKTILYRLPDGIGVGLYAVSPSGGGAHPLDMADLRVGGFAVSGR